MALAWWIIGILIIVLFVAIFKTQDLIFIFALIKKYGFLIIAIGLVLYISFSMYKIHTTYDIKLTSFDGIVGAGKIYLNWLMNIFKNFGRISGYAIQQNWVSVNETNVTIK